MKTLNPNKTKMDWASLKNKVSSFVQKTFQKIFVLILILVLSLVLIRVGTFSLAYYQWLKITNYLNHFIPVFSLWISRGVGALLTVGLGWLLIQLFHLKNNRRKKAWIILAVGIFCFCMLAYFANKNTYFDEFSGSAKYKYYRDFNGNIVLVETVKNFSSQTGDSLMVATREIIEEYKKQKTKSGWEISKEQLKKKSEGKNYNQNSNHLIPNNFCKNPLEITWDTLKNVFVMPPNYQGIATFEVVGGVIELESSKGLINFSGKEVRTIQGRPDSWSALKTRKISGNPKLTITL